MFKFGICLKKVYVRNSGSQFYKTTTAIQSGPGTFDKSRFVMTFQTILAVKFLVITARLVLERKTGKEIPKSSRLEFLAKFSANNFTLSDAEDNTSGSLNRGGIADLLLLRTVLAIHQKAQKPSFLGVMDSFILLAYAGMQLQEPFCNDY